MRIDETDLPPNERFGRVFAVIFLALGTYWAFTDWMVGSISALVFGAVIGMLAQFRPETLRKPNRAWALLGLGLGKVVGTLVLGLVFLTIITPLAIWFRIIGRDELRLRRSGESSYWRPRDVALAKSKFHEQF